MSSSVQQTYRYPSASVIDRNAGVTNLALAGDISASGTPCYFRGRLLRPDVSAANLRAVADLVAARFYTPPAMVERLIREADPVFTVAGDCLRIEGFSACCSAYLRHDLRRDSFVAETCRPGTTNVDFRTDMRAALAQVRSDESLVLSVGTETVTLATEDVEVIERTVPLPRRWLQGFCEIQSHLAGMALRASLSRVAAQRFLRGLPRAKTDTQQWLVKSHAGLRLIGYPGDDAMPVRGLHRLRVLEPLVSRAESLQVYHNPALGSSAWLLDFGDQSLTLALNTEPWRGFSGDGQTLLALATAESPAVAALRAQLQWQSLLDADSLASATRFSRHDIDTALAALAARAIVGFDLASGRYFHRVLPFDLQRLDTLHPRLASARRLQADGKVTLGRRPGVQAAVTAADGTTHAVGFEDDDPRCTCPWFAKHGVARGPCKHILAAIMVASVSV